MNSHTCLVRRWVLAAGLLAGAPVAAQAPSQSAIDSYVADAMKRWDVPGLSLAIVRNGEVLVAKGYGVRELGRPETVDGNTIFPLGSTTKAFGATAVAMLIDDGKLSWGDRIDQHLPWFRLYDPWMTHELRVKDILAHRVGAGSMNQLRDVAKNRKDFLMRLQYGQPAHGFREQYGYTNDMYILSGQLVEETSGMTWDEFSRRRVWEPLGMTSTTSRMAKAKANPNHATPHIIKERYVGSGKTAGPPLGPIPWEYQDDVAVPSGGVASSARDMAEWLKFHLNQGAGKDILSARSKRMLHAPHTVVETPDWWMIPERYPAYAMGWATGEFEGMTVMAHGGEGPGFDASVAFLPNEGIGVFVASNRESQLPFLLTRYLLASLNGKGKTRDWHAEAMVYIDKSNTAAREAENRRVSGRVKGVGPSLPLAKYVGTFTNNFAGNLRVKLGGAGLVAELDARNGPLVFDLEHWHIDQFSATKYRVPMFFSFAIDENGAVTGLRANYWGTFQRAAQ